jgi:hypothetical protein
VTVVGPEGGAVFEQDDYVGGALYVKEDLAIPHSIYVIFNAQRADGLESHHHRMIVRERFK